MPRYFFSVKGAVVAHASGCEELPDDLSAHQRAELTAAQLVGGALNGYVIIVKGEDGSVVTEVPICSHLH